MSDQDDINKSGAPQEGEDAYGHDQDQAPFAPNNEPLDVEQSEEDDLGAQAESISEELDAVDPGEEAERIGTELESVELEADHTPTPETPEEETTNPAELGESSLPVIPEIADEGRAPFGADIAGVDLAEELPGGGLERAGALPDFEELDNTQSALERFGNDVERFNDAGGADNSIPNLDDDGGDEGDGQQQLNDADLGNRDKMSEMLIEHARRLDEQTRFLEMERL